MIPTMLDILAGAIMATSLLTFAVAVVATIIIPPIVLIVACMELAGEVTSETPTDDRYHLIATG